MSNLPSRVEQALDVDAMSIKEDETSVTVGNDEDEESDYEYCDSDDEYPTTTLPIADRQQRLSKESMTLSIKADREKSAGKRRLMQDLVRIMNQEAAGFSMKPLNEDSMDKWSIELFNFDQDSNLAKDMKRLGIPHIQLKMTFPEQYPFEPPYVQVIRPTFVSGSGYVLNGALCMELLTLDGWNPINDIESVIVSIRSHLVQGDGRIEGEGKGVYDDSAAKDNFDYLSKLHKEKGWSDHMVRKG